MGGRPRAPLLTGTLARRARAVLEAIAEWLLGLEPASVATPALARGLAGIALAHDALETQFPGRGHRARARACIRGAGSLLAQGSWNSTLFDGATGVAWVVERLGERGAAFANDPSVDSVVADWLGDTWRGPFDCVSGLVGYGVFALERLPRRGARANLVRIVRHLDAAATPKPGGVVWVSRPSFIPRPVRPSGLRSHVDLGLAHGVPSVIAFLAKVVERGVGGQRAASLLDRGASWLAAQRLRLGPIGAFPQFIGLGAARAPARIAWCYGDLGVASSLWLAGRAMRRAAWKRIALEVARAAAARDEIPMQSSEPGLCHGAAGAAHMFLRLHRETGDPSLRRAARVWFSRLVEMCQRRPSDAEPSEKNGSSRSVDPGFLVGAAGVALALCAAVESGPPDWDRVLLLPGTG